MKKTTILAIAMFAVVLASTFAMLPVKAPARADVDIRFYGSHEAAYTALKAGSVDFIQWSVTYEQRLDVEADPNLAIAGFTENGMDQFDLNNNYTLPMTYPGIRNPVNDVHFRRALSAMVDKDHIVNFILKGAAGVLNVPIPLNSLSWWPDSCLPENYPWNYDETVAANELAAGGFVDIDSDGTLNYPANWPGRLGQPEMDPLVMYVRTEDKRLDAGRYFYDQLVKFKIPINKIEATSDVCFPAVMDDLNYHIYTGGWSLGRYPTFLYNGFHSDFWYSGGSNYVTGMNASNLPNYPDYDELAYAVYYTTDIEAAKVAAKLAADLGWANYVFNIPLWSYSSYVAWRKTMPGVINEFGYGYDNFYQFLNAYNTIAGTPIRMGTIAAPKSLNPIYATWYYDYAVLNRVFDSGTLVNPYDLATDQPGAFQDWEVGQWIDPSPGPDEPTTKTTVTYYIRKGSGIVSPTGVHTGDFNAYDLAFSTWYTYAFDDGWNWVDYQDVHHSEIIDDYTIKFYFDSASYWFYTAPQYPIFARDETINLICTTDSVTFTTEAPLAADAALKLPTTDQIVEVTSENIPSAYYIFGGYEDYEHNWIRFPAGLAAGTYTITYYTDTGIDPHGYYLAGLPWQQTWYGFGPFYPVAISEGVGGFASLNINPYFYFPTAPLSEVDWAWVWETPGGVPGPANPGRDSGHFEISIYDVVKATASYGHYGTGPYDPAYFPGADLEDSDLGHIGIFDVVSITSNYGMTWGTPPP